MNTADLHAERLTGIGGSDALTLDRESHVYRLGQSVIPSVTQIIEAARLVDFSAVPDAVLENAQWRGSAIHAACWYEDERALDETTVLPEHLGYLAAWRKFKSESGFRPMAIEESRRHDLYLYAGTPDRSGDIGPSVAVVDLKSGPLQPAVAIQLAAYAHLYPHPSIYRRIAVRLKADGTYSGTEFERRELQRDFAVFSSALTVFNWRKEHKL